LYLSWISEKIAAVTDPRAHQVLAGVSRVAVLEVLRRAGQALPVQEIADRVRLHPNTVRTHLDLLVEHGHARAEVERRTGPGRPRIVYSAVTRPAGDPGDETRNYRLLAQILAGHLAMTSPQPAASAVAAGRSFGQGLAGGAGRGLAGGAGRGLAGDTDRAPAEAGTVDPVDRLVELLAVIGFEPEPGPDGASIRLHHCPFREMAEENRDLVCGVHLGLMQGALGVLSAPVSATRLLPFVEPDLCLAVLGAEDAAP
jgi:predicted ArsR family transcriptional regulator